MSGRRRVKNVAYDEDEWGYNDDDWDEDDDYYEPEVPARPVAPLKKSTSGGASGRVPATKTPSRPSAKNAKDGAASCGSEEESSRGRRSQGPQQSANSDSKSVTCKSNEACHTQNTFAPNAEPLSASSGMSAAKPREPRNGSEGLDSPAPSSAAVRTPGRPEPLSLVVVGHVDAGKSTLVGQLLLSTGTVEENVIQKMKRLSGEAGKGSFFLAWLCDEGDDERERGVTVDVSIRVVVTPNTGRRLALVDAPGHREFVCNMLGGAALADVALLVVDTARFDAGFDGQTKEHLLIARCLGIQHFLVALNKMDELAWSEEMYAKTVERLRAYMVGPDMNCAPGQISFVPISAFRGVNVVNADALAAIETARAEGRGKRKPDPRSLADAAEREHHMQALARWWKGPTVLDAIERLEIRSRSDQQKLLSEPFAACVADAWSPSASSADVHLSFKVVQGVLRVGDTVVGLPGETPIVCRSLVSFGETRESCESGDIVERGVFSPGSHGSRAVIDVCVGSVLCARSHPLPVTAVCLCRLMVFGTDLPLVQGRQFVAHIHTFSGACTIRKIAGVINKKTGELQGAPGGKRAACAALGRGMVGLVEIATASRVCVQVKSTAGKQDGKDAPTSVLSHIIIRDRGKTVAAGVIVATA
ncbi:UNVERIFIED_CONTAM: elongation factor Tu GTP binding domain-containing protein [Hammondia hammondi]|eukprot:XP_008886225.1 elongation factor Tu GTP binding domain-containing protein [Hammondia hammondi]